MKKQEARRRNSPRTPTPATPSPAIAGRIGRAATARLVNPAPVVKKASTIQETWKQYGKDPSETHRNTLWQHYLPLVKYTADRIHHRLPAEVEVDDLYTAGSFGLMNAIASFDPSRGIKFETFCAPRIRGAIMDELRAMDPQSRLVRSRQRLLERERERFIKQNGYCPTEDELAVRLDLDRREFDRICRDGEKIGVVSLHQSTGNGDSRDMREIDMIDDTRQFDPSFLAHRDDLKEIITRGLSRAERLIVVLYYFEGMTMREIGVTLDLSESRVSQMHALILARLKAQLQGRLKEFQAAVA